MPRIAFGFGGRPAPEWPSNRSNGLGGALASLGGLLAAGAALTVGALLAVFAAAAVAVIAVIASILVFLTGLALRARRRVYARAGSSQVIEARKVGHAWVAYGWDRTAR
ncbi:MAG: hypothetical protein JSR45_15605 [Proteobacteria bacterium]|nr:hypothetical protein [Pseudomonadota bacterium]